MAERKPPGMGYETWVDKQIREAEARGEFDDLPLAGKPLPPRRPGDEYTWIREKLAREGESTDALLPTPLRLRKEIHRLPETLRDIRTEQAVRDVVRELNEQVMQWLRAPSGPQIPVAPVDADTVVAEWRTARAERAAAEQQVQAERAAAAELAAAEAAAEATEARRERRRNRLRWWRRPDGPRADRTR
ncbi:DUF1992 domain-containing protein [Jiangella mangrovi]|uniref:DnaJ homologue subfamily C member 28 conserved domain-containing protein n=1 Tax=Jiangella mangrovi TaxID=1524084 RepID=A0A7W9LK88_9ACTN|nr:DUF1992 domain-containing protein [Jiangella mangrovi]MBB5786851.1 hypothetical protein [Jiangella mangrovi]